MKSRLKLSLEIAIRFLLSKSRGNFLSFITIISIIGVSVGVLALLVVTSVVNGFENELSRVITGTQGEVLFYTRASPIRDRGALEKKIREFAPGIEAMTGSFVSEVMFHGPDGVGGGVLEGVDLASWSSVLSVGNRLSEGGALPVNDGEILLGSALAEKLGVKVGEAIRVIIPFSSMEEDEDQGFGAPRVQDFKLVGIVHLGMYDYDSKYAYAPLSSVQRLVYGEDLDFITSFRIKLKNPAAAQAVGAELSQHFGFPYRVRDWSQLNRNLLYAIKLEKRSSRFSHRDHDRGGVQCDQRSAHDGVREGKGNLHSQGTWRKETRSFHPLCDDRIGARAGGHRRWRDSRILFNPASPIQPLHRVASGSVPS